MCRVWPINKRARAIEQETARLAAEEAKAHARQSESAAAYDTME